MNDTMFYTTLRRGYDVDLLSACYTEAVNVWPHPQHGHIVFPMTFPQASLLEQQHPEFSVHAAGLCGQWRLERKEGSNALTLSLVRKVDDLLEFWALVRKDNVNPSWLASCFDTYRTLGLEEVAALAQCDQQE